MVVVAFLMVVFKFLKVTLLFKHLHVSVNTKRGGESLLEIIYYGSLGWPWIYIIFGLLS
jgi:hypothetical protein